MSDKSEKSQPETGPSATTLEEAHEAGFLGTVADPEPNESYQLGGKLAQSPEKTGPDSPEDVKGQLKEREETSSHKSGKS